jgi:hypothetical protein
MKNATEIYGEGYLKGYTQCRVDKGEISQEEGDRIMQSPPEATPSAERQEGLDASEGGSTEEADL